MVAPIRECRGLPWVEHNERFCAIVERFLVRYDLIDDTR